MGEFCHLATVILGSYYVSFYNILLSVLGSTGHSLLNFSVVPLPHSPACFYCFGKLSILCALSWIIVSWWVFWIKYFIFFGMTTFLSLLFSSNTDWYGSADITNSLFCTISWGVCQCFKFYIIREGWSNIDKLFLIQVYVPFSHPWIHLEHSRFHIYPLDSCQFMLSRSYISVAI